MTLTALMLLSLRCVSPEPEQPSEPDAIASEQEAEPSEVPTGVEEVEAEIGPESEPAPQPPVSEAPASIEPEPEPVSEPEPEPKPVPELEPESESEPVYDPFVEQPQTPVGSESKGKGRYGKRGPPVYGPILAGAGLGASSRSVSLGGSLTGFVIPWVGIGASLDNTLYFGGPFTFYEFGLVPHLFLLALPYSRFTPYVRGGIGLQAFTGGLGVYAQWQGGGGFIWRLGAQQRLALRAGVEVVGSIPDARFAQSFQCGLTNNPCSLALRPSLGVGYRFGRN